MLAKRLISYLESENAEFDTLTHEPSFTAQETAAAAHVPGKALAKTIIMKIDGELGMVVVPAPDRVEMRSLQEALGTGDVALADEKDFTAAFPDCEAGAMPPFGNLYGMCVFVSDRLREDEHICFNGGSHTVLVELSYADFERLVGPTPVRL